MLIGQEIAQVEAIVADHRGGHAFLLWEPCVWARQKDQTGATSGDSLCFIFDLLKLFFLLCFPLFLFLFRVGFKGNLSLLEIYIFASGLEQIEAIPGI